MKKIIYCSYIILSGAICKAQIPVIEWSHCYGGTSYDAGLSLQITSDGGYIFFGGTFSPDGDVVGYHPGNCVDFPCLDNWVVKTDSLGNMQWQKCLGGSNDEYGLSVIQNSDSGYTLIGFTYSNNGDVSGNHGLVDTWIVKLNASGMLIWQKCYGGSANDGPNAGILTSDDGFISCGLSYSNDGDVTGHHGSANTTDIWILKGDSSGNMQWQKSIGGSQDDRGWYITQINEGYILFGQTFSIDGDVTTTGYGFADYWMCKLDTAGNIIWQKDYGGSGDDVVRSAKQTRDGGYILAGYTNSNDFDVSGNHGYDDIWVVKTDSMGDLQWQKCLGGVHLDEAYAVDTTSDGGYIIAGFSNSEDGDISNAMFDTIFDNAWVVKLDSVGNIVWDKSLGGSGNEGATAIRETSDGGYIVLGGSNSNDGDVIGNHGGLSDFWAVKLSSPYVGIAAPTNLITDFTSYLSNSILFLNFYANSNERLLAGKAGAHVQLLDITGRVLLSQPLGITEGYNKKQVHVGKLSAGVYFVRVVSEGSGVTKKLMVH